MGTLTGRSRSTKPAVARRGFSLIELLVVIMVIIILVGLLVPAIGMVRGNSRQTQCASRLRQLGGAYAKAALCLQSVRPDLWPTQLAGSVDNRQIAYFCPDDPGATTTAPSYGMNTRANRMAAGDGRRIVMLDYKKTQAQYVVLRGTDQDDWRAQQAPRHRGRQNVLFFDLGVQPVTAAAIDPRICDIYENRWRPFNDANFTCLTTSFVGDPVDIPTTGDISTGGGGTTTTTASSGTTTGGTTTGATTAGDPAGGGGDPVGGGGATTAGATTAGATTAGATTAGATTAGATTAGATTSGATTTGGTTSGDSTTAGSTTGTTATTTSSTSTSTTSSTSGTTTTTTSGTTTGGSTTGGSSSSGPPASTNIVATLCGPFIGIDSISVSGRVYADSYDSGSGAYNSGGAGQGGSVCSNGDIEIKGTARIYGDAHPGPGYTVSGASKVTGSTTPLTSAMNLAPVDVHDSATNNANAGIPLTSGGRNPLANGAFSLQDGESITLPAGTYYFSELTVPENAMVNLAGPTIIYCTGSISVHGAVVTPTPRASNLVIYCTGPTVDLSGQAVFYGQIYAPSSDISRSGGSSEFYGALIGKSLKLSGGGALHYDSAP